MPNQRANRVQARRQERASRERRRAVLYGSGVLALALVIAGVAWYSNRAQAGCGPVAGEVRNLYSVLPPSRVAGVVKVVASPYGKPLPPPGPEFTVPDEGRTHVTDPVINYQHTPPASGPHYAVPAQYQFNTTEVPEGNWVHSLEHGAIVVLYQCDTGRVTAIAWDHELPMQGVDLEAVKAFYAKYVDQGPERGVP